MFLSFLMWPSLMMPMFALISAWLLRFDHPANIMDLFQASSRTGKGA